jgi:hypothetical protein
MSESMPQFPRRERVCTEPTKCRSCGAEILWVEWPLSGKKMPMDLAPTTEGDIVVMHRKEQNKLLAERYDADRHVNRKRYVSHFTTCPSAAEHRRE